MNAVLERDTPERTPGTAVVTTPMALIELALKQGANIDVIERLVKMRDHAEAEAARKAFAAAMVQFKSEPLEIRKNKRVAYANKAGGKTDYRHATLDEVCDKIIARLSKVGIAHRWVPEQKGNTIKVTCVLTHELGHSESTCLEGPHDDSGGKNAIQAVGSTTHYLERYTVLAATGLAVKDADDDGQGGARIKSEGEGVYRVEPRQVVDGPVAREAPAPEKAPPPPANTNPMTDGQRRIIRAKLKNAKLSDVDVQAKFGKSIEDKRWLHSDFQDVQAWIDTNRK
jgi:hypothetical protein